MRENKGFSLIELIVVVAILAVLAGGAVSMLGLVPRWRVRSLSQKLVTQVDRARTSAMSFKDAEITILRKTDGIYARTETTRGSAADSAEEQIGDPSVEVWYVLGDGGPEQELTDAGTLTLGFIRSSGAFALPSVNGSPQTQYCTEIIIRSGSYEARLKLTPVTGRITG